MHLVTALRETGGVVSERHPGLASSLSGPFLSLMHVFVRTDHRPPVAWSSGKHSGKHCGLHLWMPPGTPPHLFFSPLLSIVAKVALQRTWNLQRGVQQGTVFETRLFHTTHNDIIIFS